MSKRVIVLLALFVVAVWALALPVLAETYNVPGGPGEWHAVSVGTDGSDAEPAYVSVSQGGCTFGYYVAVAVGESSRDCYHWGYNYGSYEAVGGELGVGLLGADSAGGVAVSDTGDAQGCSGCNLWVVLGYECTGVGMSATGNTSGCQLAVSGTGNADATLNGSAVALLGDASARRDEGDNGAGHAVSGAGNASGWSALSGTGDADGSGVGVAGGDAHGGLVAVSLTGDASGSGVVFAPLGSGD